MRQGLPGRRWWSRQQQLRVAGQLTDQDLAQLLAGSRIVVQGLEQQQAQHNGLHASQQRLQRTT